RCRAHGCLLDRGGFSVNTSAAAFVYKDSTNFQDAHRRLHFEPVLVCSGPDCWYAGRSSFVMSLAATVGGVLVYSPDGRGYSPSPQEEPLRVACGRGLAGRVGRGKSLSAATAWHPSWFASVTALTSYKQSRPHDLNQ